jgi:solute carrier family 25 carnitine/acylcarnitine transporter 20/29
MVSFLAGGMGATFYWIGCFPADVIKNRQMSQPDIKPRLYPTIRITAQKIFAAEGLMGFWRGFVPCMLRSFPTNGAALWVFDNTLRMLSKADVVKNNEVRDGIVVHEMIEE